MDAEETTVANEDRESKAGPLSHEKREGDFEQLRNYTRRKLAIASQLRTLVDILKKRGSESQFRRCEELMVKLAEDRFTLAVVGQFKRGKSSLMNAIIGRELLPTGVLPLTSAITVLRFGSQERVVVHHDGLQFPEIVPVSALPNYVTERGNPGNRRKVKTAAVEVPLPFLRRGLEFVDTPGVGSAIEANSATTYRFLPKCDAVIFVTSVDSPFSEAELNFLSAIREHVRKIFFVVNKTDLLRDQRERDEVLKFIESELRGQMEISQIRIFPVSSLLALAKTGSAEGDGAICSGLKEFEETLTSFLANEKAAVFLTAIIEKALRLVDEETHAIELYKRAREIPRVTVAERLDAVASKWRELATARQKISQRLRDALEEAARESSAWRLDELLEADQETFSRHLRGAVANSGWRVGDEVANRWTAFVFKKLATTTASWIAEVAPGLGLELQPVAIKAEKQLEANLREIPKLAAAALDLQFPESELALPHLGAEAFAHSVLAPKERSNELGIALRCLPVCLTVRWFEPALKDLTNQLVKIHRAHALALIIAGVKGVVDKWASAIDELASEIESRVKSTITGEQAGSLIWRQTSSPIADRGWGGVELASIRVKLTEIRDPEVLHRTSPKEAAVEASQISELPRRSEAVATRPKQIDLASDLRTRGCPVCDHVIKAAHDFFAQWQYALASDENAQRRFAADLGFCSLHTWQLHAMSSPLGESIGLAPLAEEISRVLPKTLECANTSALSKRRHVTALQKMLHTTDTCRVCRLLREVESNYVERLNAFLTEENNRKLYERSQGVCLRHLTRLIAITSKEIRAFLVGEASRHFGEIAEDMQGYAIKRDAIRRHLTNANEDDAYMRALIHLVGAKDYSTPWPDDREI